MSSHINQYRPWMPWHHIVGESHGIIKVSPGFALGAVTRGNLCQDTLLTLTTTVVTSRIINRIMGRHEDFGA